MPHYPGGIMSGLAGLLANVLDSAKVAKLVDALDLGSSGAARESSSLSFRTIQFHVPAGQVIGPYLLKEAIHASFC
jgi:hypothetical protein